MSEPVIILQVLAEGGGLSLLGFETDQGWRFALKIVDHSPLMIDEPAIERQSDLVDTFDDGVVLLDQYPWYRMRPDIIHPAFRGRIRAVIDARIAQGLVPSRSLDAWRECFDAPDASHGIL